MLLRQTILYLPAQVVGPLFQFIAVVAWTHFLTPHDLGLFALVAAAQELAYTAVLFWFTLFTMRYHDPEGAEGSRRRFLDTESAVVLATSVLTAASLLLLPLFVEGAWSWELEAAAIAYSVTRGIVTQYADRARTEHDTVSYTILQICWPVFGLGLGILFVNLYGGRTESVLFGYAVAQALSIILVLPRLGFGRAPHHASMEQIRRAVGYGLPLVLGAVLIWVANNGIRFVVEHADGAAAVGLLTVGWGLGLRATAFASMLTTAAAFPVAMKRARDSGMDAGQDQLERNGLLLLAALAPIAVGLWDVSEPFVNLVVASDYRATTVAILPLAVLAGAARSFRIHFGEQVFMLREAPTVPLINDLIDAVASMVGSYIGLLLAGLPGAVAGSAAAAVLSLIVTLAWGWKRYRFTIPIDGLIKITIASAAMGLIVGRMPIAATVPSIATAVLTGALVYGLALALLYPEARSYAQAAVVRLRAGGRATRL